MSFIDNFLNRITMYRLVLYVLIIMLALAAIFGYFGLLPYSPVSILFSAAFVTIVCWITNTFASWAFNAPINVESAYITALILALIIAPIKAPGAQNLAFLFWASVLAIASKYVIAIGKKHIFNPAAFAVAVTALTMNQNANWWIGTSAMLPSVIVGGFLIVRKIKRGDLCWSFFAAAAVSIFGFAIARGAGFGATLNHLLVNSPLVFFATVMLTEPLTTPPTKHLRIAYGVLVGLLFAPQVHIGQIYSTPELALLTGNFFSYLASPKQKLVLELRGKIRLAPTIFDFVFSADKKIKFKPGQYLEWTLEHEKSDSRGCRRYFTIASSPTEKGIILGVKFYDPPSSYKEALFDLKPGDKIIASQLAGDFTLPKNPRQKLAFIAGGIGITPFRSMIKYLLDKNQPRDIVVFYSNRDAQDIVYGEILETAGKRLGIKTIYAITDPNTGLESALMPGQNSAALPSQKPAALALHKGPITERLIASELPDFSERVFYISGPRSMIKAYEKTLGNMGVAKNKIKTDYFPGFA